jgi:SdrD B-like domain
MRRMGWVIIAALLLISSTVYAQTSGGQFCVRAFEDTNANGKLDAGEALLTHGINVNLLDAQNVTIASALLDQSPTAAQGVACFQFLAAGQYTVNISSAEYKATTPASITTTINDSGTPTVVEFGGQSLVAPAGSVDANAGVTAPAADADTNQLVRILISVAGTLIVIIGMSILGFIVYMLAFGRRPPPPDLRRTTGSLRAVELGDTGKMKTVNLSDTGRTKKVE